ncbi:hypothetical protein GmHk_03G007103 [Glycine max]|nr:hypothetical protein GmHk_03G007103 [Glycine max]
MQEFDGSDNYDGPTNDKVAFVSRKFKQGMKKKGKFQHFSICKDYRFKKKSKDESNEIIYLSVENLDI